MILVVRGLASRLRLKLVHWLGGYLPGECRQGAGISSEIETDEHEFFHHLLNRRQGAGISSEIETKMSIRAGNSIMPVVRGLASRLRLKHSSHKRAYPSLQSRQGAGISSEIETIQPTINSSGN